MPSKAPRDMTAGQWRDFEYRWLKWLDQKLEACR
jgi:hypothetical protein